MKTKIAKDALFVGLALLVVAAAVAVLTFGDMPVFHLDRDVSRLGAIVCLGLGGLLFAGSAIWLDKHYRPVAEAEKALRTNVTEPFQELKTLLYSINPPLPNEIMTQLRSIASYAYDHEYASEGKFADFANNPSKLSHADGREVFFFLVHDLTLRRREAIGSKREELDKQ